MIETAHKNVITFKDLILLCWKLKYGDRFINDLVLYEMAANLNGDLNIGDKNQNENNNTLMEEPQQVQQSTELFILEDKKEFKIKLPLQKVLGFCPMLNNTCVIMAIKSHRVEMIGHYDQEGNILKEHVFIDSNLFPYCIPTDRDIIWVDCDRNLLLQWNLENYELLEFDFQFENNKADSHEVFFFPDTKLLAVAEWGRQDSNFLKFTYFNYPLTKESEPVHTYEDDEVWTNEYTVRRANNRSMFVWFKSSHKDNFEFKTFEPILKTDGTYDDNYQLYTTKNTIPIANDNQSAAELSVGYMWELSKGKFGVISITERKQEGGEYPKAIFVYETESNLFREANFAPEGKFRFQYIHWHSFGNTFMCKGFDWEKGNALESPVYFFDNATETLAATSKWNVSHLSKYSFPGYDGNMIIDAEYENINVDKIVSSAIKVVDPRELYIHLLEKYINNVEDDLAIETVHLLSFEK